jgi:hypothetical protein
MDWIERLLGLAPDGGNGATEMLVIAAVTLVAAGIYWISRVPHRSHDSSRMT